MLLAAPSSVPRPAGCPLWETPSNVGLWSCWIWRRPYFMGLSFNKQLEKLFLSSYEQFKQKMPAMHTKPACKKKKIPNPFNIKRV